MDQWLETRVQQATWWMFSVSIKVSVCERVACYRVWTCGVLPFVNVWRVTVCERVACYRVWTCGVLPFVNVWRVTVCERVTCYRVTCGVLPCDVLPCVNVSCVAVCERVACYRVWTCDVLNGSDCDSYLNNLFFVICTKGLHSDMRSLEYISKKK